MRLLWLPIKIIIWVVPTAFESSVKAVWIETDEAELIWYIADHKSEAGDGMKFKALFWTGVAVLLQLLIIQGGPKTSSGCSAKWDRVGVIVHTVWHCSHFFLAQEGIQYC